MECNDGESTFCASQLDKIILPLADQRLEVLLNEMRIKNRLYHQTLLGKKPKQEGLLEDYAFLMDAIDRRIWQNL